MARKPPPPRGPQLELAGDLSVAFVNTAAARKDNRQIGVGSYADLLFWGQQTGLLSAHEVERLGQRAQEKPGDEKAVFDSAEKLRSALIRTFSAFDIDQAAAADDLGVVSETLALAMPSLRLVQDEDGVAWRWAGGEDALDQVLWPVLLAAAELLTSDGGCPTIRQCAAESCSLFFAQRRPVRRNRIWCDMKTCGARAKSLRYYHRTGKFYKKKDWLYR